MLDAESDQMFKLNFTKSNSTQAGDLFFVQSALGQMMPANMADYTDANAIREIQELREQKDVIDNEKAKKP